MSASGIAIGPGVSIGPGWGIGSEPPPLNLVLSLDAGNPASYPGSGTTWTDTVGSVPFTLYSGVTYNSANGGYLTFDSGAGQYAQSPSIAQLPTWSVEAWHYYTGANTGGSPCIVTDTFLFGNINYTLGAINNDTIGLCAGWYNGSSQVWTKTGAINLTPNTWNQIVGTYDGTYPKLYVNNTLVATGTMSGGAALASGQGIRLMRRWDGTDYWGGNLAIVKIYDGALGDAGVSAEWNAHRARFGL